MTPASGDAYLNTRVSLFAERLWPDAELDALVGADAGAITHRLAQKGLALLAPTPEQGGGSLEHRIVAQMLEETRVLIRPLAGGARDFLAFWTARFEMSNVKTLLRSKMSGERAAAALARLAPMGTFGRLDSETLAHAEDAGELLRRLEAGPYAAVVRHARRAFEQSRDPFVLDAALDQGYYEGLVARAQFLETRLGAPLRGLMAALVDRINLVWLLRYRFNYDLPPAQVYYLLIGSRYDLPVTRLRELAQLDSLPAVLDALPAPWRAQLVGARDIPDVFARMEQAGAGQALRVLRGHAPPLARAFAYLILRERDLRALRGVLRGRRLGLAAADIRVAMQRAPETLH